MTNPQTENGYTKIATEFIDHFCRYRLSGREWQILWCIIRKTWGWQKTTDAISLSQLSNMTGISKDKCCKIMKLLVNRGVAKKGNSIPITYSIQKNYNCWKGLPKMARGCQKGQLGVAKKGNKGLPKKATTKDIKDTIQYIGKKFVKPSINEVRAYIEENSYNVDADSFINFYESKGWVVGKSPMKNWQAAVRTWNKNNKNTSIGDSHYV